MSGMKGFVILVRTCDSDLFPAIQRSMVPEGRVHGDTSAKDWPSLV